MNNPDVRRWIIIDEIPGFIREFAKVSKLHLGLLSKPDGHAGFVPMTLDEMKVAYYTFADNTDAKLFDSSTTLGKLKVDSVLSMIQRDWHRMINSKSEYVIRFSPSDLKTSRSLVLIMEGAGDVLFKGSTDFLLQDKPDKYKGRASFKPITMPGLGRQNDEKQIKAMINVLLSIMSTAKGKTLIVCWSDIKGDTTMIDDNNNSDDSPLVSRIKQELAQTNLVTDSYSVIYYGSSDSRAVNTYKDYSNIILIGKWSLPISSSSDKFKKAFNTETTHTRYMLWEYIQLITRTRIRLDQDINVYYTDDHKQDFIDTLDRYFNKNTLYIPEEYNDWRNKVKSIKYGSKSISNIEKLSQRFPFITEMILENGGNQKKLSISLGELNKILGLRKKSKDYNILCNLLKRFGIILELKKKTKG